MCPFVRAEKVLAGYLENPRITKGARYKRNSGKGRASIRLCLKNERSPEYVCLSAEGNVI